MNQPATVTQKKPINRKLLYVALMGLLVLGIFGIIAVIVNDPRKASEDRAAERARAALEAMPEGTEEAARRQLMDQARRLQAANRPATPPPAAPAATRQPGGLMDDEFLRQLDEAQRAVGGSPNVAGTGNRGSGDMPPLFAGPASTGGGGDRAGILYDSYKPATTLVDAEGHALFGDDADATAGSYATIKPNTPPALGIVSQGTAIQAVLMTRIDTRNAGPITAMVRRTVYDSFTQRTPLIPQGARLVGHYETNVQPGVDRVEVKFERLILPDGRSFALQDFPSSAPDGTIGVGGEYHSNFLRAIGPAVMVALLGEAADRKLQQQIPVTDTSATPGLGGTYQSPTVLQQTMPQINNAIMQRYAGAKPYFTAQPGQAIRVVVTADLQMPSSTEAAR